MSLRILTGVVGVVIVVLFVHGSALAQQPITSAAECAAIRQQIDEFARVLRGHGAVIDSIVIGGGPSVLQRGGTITLDLQHPVARREVDAAIRFLEDSRPGESREQVERLLNTEVLPAYSRIRAVPAQLDMVGDAELSAATNTWAYASNIRYYWAACGSGQGAAAAQQPAAAPPPQTVAEIEAEIAAAEAAVREAEAAVAAAEAEARIAEAEARAEAAEAAAAETTEAAAAIVEDAERLIGESTAAPAAPARREPVMIDPGGLRRSGMRTAGGVALMVFGGLYTYLGVYDESGQDIEGPLMLALGLSLTGFGVALASVWSDVDRPPTWAVNVSPDGIRASKSFGW